MTNDQAIALGTQVAIMLGLIMVDGKYSTTWGDKTPEGLGRVINIIVRETEHII